MTSVDPQHSSVHTSHASPSQEGKNTSFFGHQEQQKTSPFFSIQPKLEIGKPDDPYEQEADAMADKLVSKSGAVAGTPWATGGGWGLSTKSTQPFFRPSSQVQRMPAFESEEGGIQAKGQATSQAPSHIERSLAASRGGGTSMGSSVKTEMEHGFGADFSQVRIHTGHEAIQMSQAIGAQAFTHGSDIYFNQGSYQPASQKGRHLLAHELTHTLQQGAAVQRKPDLKSGIGKRIQRFSLGGAWDAVSGAVSGAVDFVSDGLDAGKRLLMGELRDFVANIPGYRLFTVVLGRDPISSTTVARSGLNFIEAGLDVIPGGTQLKQKLEEEGALAEAAAWLDIEIETLDFSPSEIASEFSSFWSSLSLTDLGSPRSVLNRVANIFSPRIDRLFRFATNVARKMLEIVKNYLINSLIDFIKEQTTAYPLLTLLLGQDPISGEAVEPTAMNILIGFISLAPEGEEQLRQMQETGSLQQMADWLTGAVGRLNLSVEVIISSFDRIWELATIENLMRPIETFQEVYQIIAGPVGRIVNFLIEVAAKIIEYIKAALLSRMSAWAGENVPGYPLITVMLGRDPFTGSRVPRTIFNIIRGFFSLMPGGLAKFEELEQTGAITNMAARIEGAIAALGITWAFIIGLFTEVWTSLGLADLANPIAAFIRILEKFGEPIARLFAFVFTVIKEVVTVLLQIMNFPVDLIGSIVTQAMQAYQDIKRDPIGFFLNLLRAVKEGFTQFFDNILTHLLTGLADWLFGEIEGAGITRPPDLSFGSILTLVLEILGLGMERIWQKLAEHIGQEKVDKIRGAIDTLSGVWSFIRDVVTEGPGAIWKYIQDQLSNLWNLVIDQVRNWIMTKIIAEVTTKLLSMLDPTGIMAVVNSFVAFYRAVQSFIEKLREMLEVVNSFVAGVAEIARGDVSKAANFLEGALAQAVPVAIGFLANQVGLGDIGSRISEMIEVVREKVDQALDWLIGKAVAAGGALLNFGRSVRDGVLGLLGIRESYNAPDGSSHSLYVEEGQETLMMASRPMSYTAFLDSVEPSIGDDAQKRSAMTQARTIVTQFYQIRAEANPDSDPGIISDKRRRMRVELNRLWQHTTILLDGQGTVATGDSRDDPIPFTWYKNLNNTQLYPPINMIDNDGGRTGAFDIFDPHQEFNHPQLPGVSFTLGVDRSSPESGGFGIQVGSVIRRIQRSRGSKTGEFRYLLEQFDARIGSGAGIPIEEAGVHIDHVLDLNFGGDDIFLNLWPYDASANTSAGNRQNNQVLTYMDRASGELRAIQAGHPSLIGKFFKVEEVEN